MVIEKVEVHKWANWFVAKCSLQVRTANIKTSYY